MDILAFSTFEDSNLRQEKGFYSTYESSKCLTLSIQTLIEKHKAVVFETVEGMGVYNVRFYVPGCTVWDCESYELFSLLLLISIALMC